MEVELNLTHLHEDVLLHIFGFMEAPRVCGLARVCHLFALVAKHNSLWRDLVEFQHGPHSRRQLERVCYHLIRSQHALPPPEDEADASAYGPVLLPPNQTIRMQSPYLTEEMRAGKFPPPLPAALKSISLRATIESSTKFWLKLKRLERTPIVGIEGASHVTAIRAAIALRIADTEANIRAAEKALGEVSTAVAPIDFDLLAKTDTFEVNFTAENVWMEGLAAPLRRLVRKPAPPSPNPAKDESDFVSASVASIAQGKQDLRDDVVSELFDWRQVYKHYAQMPRCKSTAAVRPDGQALFYTINPGEIFRGHTNWARCTVPLIAPRAQVGDDFLLSAGDDCSLRLWSLRTGQNLGTIGNAHKGHILEMEGRRLADGSYLISTSGLDKSFRVWHVQWPEPNSASPQPLAPLWADYSAPAGDFSAPKDPAAASATKSQSDESPPQETESIFLPRLGISVRLLRDFADAHEDLIRCARFISDTQIVSASHDRRIKLWTLPTLKLERTFHWHTGYCLDCIILPGSKLLISASADKTVAIADFATGKVLANLAGHIGSVRRVRAIENYRGRWLGLLLKEKKRIDDKIHAKQQATPFGQPAAADGSQEERPIVFTPGIPLDLLIVSVSYDGTVRACFLSLPSAKIGPFRFPSPRRCLTGDPGLQMHFWHAASQVSVFSHHAHDEGVSCLQIIPDTFCSASRPYEAELAAISTSLNGGNAAAAPADDVPPVYVSNAMIVTAGYDRRTRFWDLASGTVNLTLGGPTGVICDVKVWRDYVITAATDNDITVHRFDVAGNLFIVPDDQIDEKDLLIV